jgi:hypothetical protein
VNPLLRQILLQAATWFLLLGSIAGVAVGLALLTRAPGTLAFFMRINRWVSTARALEVLEAPHGSGPVSRRDGRWMGALFMLLGGYCLVVLLSGIEAQKVAAALGLPQSRLTWLLVDSLHWMLALGCAGAVLAGALLAFFPDGWAALEARANREYWSGQLADTGDRMHLALDELVARSPRLCGALLALLSLVSSAVCAWILMRRGA